MGSSIRRIRNDLMRIKDIVSMFSKIDSNFKKELEEGFFKSSPNKKIKSLDNLINYFLTNTDDMGLDIAWKRVLLGFHLSNHGGGLGNENLIKHSNNVANISYIFVKKVNLELGLGIDLGEMYIASYLHDIGHLLTPFEIYTSDKRYSEEERMAHFKRHTLYSDMICNILGISDIPMVLNVANYHHEKYDGSGYPEKLKGEQIPIEARIVAISDLYDALRSKRTYKSGFSPEDSLNMMKCPDVTQRTNKEQFDPDLLNVFIDPKTNKIIERFVYSVK